MSHTTATRTCLKCGIEKPLTRIHYHQSFGEWKTWCRMCRGDRSRIDPEGRWRCGECGEFKAEGEFYPHRGIPSSRCKSCDNAIRVRNKKRRQFAEIGVKV